MDSNNLFGKHQILPGNTKIFVLGTSQIGIKREKEGWFVRLFENNAIQPDGQLIAEGEYFHTSKSNSIILSPALPEKPLVFKGNLMKVSPGQKLTFFLKIPLNVQIYASKNLPENLLKEIPSRQLSHTWFGEPDEGEIALAYGSEFYLNFGAVETNPFEAICPVTIVNKSTGPLELQRLIIRVENLFLYQNQNKKVTSEVEIRFEGQDSTNQSEYHYSKNYDGEKQEILAKPRSENGKNLLKMNLHFIKNIYKTE